jgi:hypothetical protein
MKRTVILEGNSISNLKLLTDLAKKLGIKVKYLTEEELEEVGILKAIEEGKTGEYVDADEFINTLRKNENSY